MPPTISASRARWLSSTDTSRRISFTIVRLEARFTECKTFCYEQKVWNRRSCLHTPTVILLVGVIGAVRQRRANSTAFLRLRPNGPHTQEEIISEPLFWLFAQSTARRQSELHSRVPPRFLVADCILPFDQNGWPTLSLSVRILSQR